MWFDLTFGETLETYDSEDEPMARAVLLIGYGDDVQFSWNGEQA